MTSYDQKQQKIKEIDEFYREAEAAWKLWYIEAQEDDEFYHGKQWNETDLAIAEKKGNPTLSINLCKKPVEIISGFERQNRSEMKAKPMENSDYILAEVMSKVMKWTLTKDNTDYKISTSFKDAVKMGLGWLYADMDYSLDVLDGDITFNPVSPFNVYIDPYTTKADLSDCEYIIHHKIMDKKRLKNLYPEYAEEIELMKDIPPMEIRMDINNPNSTGNRVLVIEYWHKQYETKIFQTVDGITTEIPNETIKNERATIIKKKIPSIKLSIKAGNVILYDGDAPTDFGYFPFIPIWGVCDFTSHKWEDKLQGIIRSLKDPQREKNKRRSQMMQSVNRAMRGGWIMDKGAVDDKKTLTDASGYGNIVEKNPGKEIVEKNFPPLDQAVVQMEMTFSEDIKLIGPNPDLLGNIMSESDSGYAIRLRQRQGLMLFQEFFDNLANAKKLMAKIMINIISKFSKAKILRVLGLDIQEMFPDKPIDEVQQIVDGFWTILDGARRQAQYDIVIDETSANPSFRAEILAQLIQAAQYKVQIDPEVFVEYMDLPVGIKNKQKASYEQQKQAANAQMQAQAAATMAETQIKGDELNIKKLDAIVKARESQARIDQMQREGGVPGKPDDISELTADYQKIFGGQQPPAPEGQEQQPGPQPAMQQMPQGNGMP